MKKFKYILLAFACAVLTGCMGGENIGFNDDWDAPSGEAPFGNNDLQETNIVTIAELKAKYLNGNDANSINLINNKEQIKVTVTGNDIAGNIYNEIAVKDATGAILICISEGGLFSYLPVGQEILVDLQDLYIGYYGNQAQIGTAYTNTSGKTFPSRMNPITWQKKFKLIGAADPSTVTPEEFDVTKIKDEDYVRSCSGKLMVVKNVEMVDGGTKQWAPEADKDAGNGVSRTIKVNGKANSNFVVRSSSYADFAAQIMPAGKVNLTGVFTVYATNPSKYGYTWQILLRSEKDIEEVK